MEKEGSPTPINLQVTIKGVVLPTWVALCLAGLAAAAAGIVLIAMLLFHNAATKQTKELRLLGLYIQDIENVLIRSGVARREDFVDPKEKEESP